MIRGRLRPFPKSKSLRAVRYVLSRGLFFCDRPNLTPSDERLECSGCSEFREISEFSELPDSAIPNLLELLELLKFLKLPMTALSSLLATELPRPAMYVPESEAERHHRYAIGNEGDGHEEYHGLHTECSGHP